MRRRTPRHALGALAVAVLGTATAACTSNDDTVPAAPPTTEVGSSLPARAPDGRLSVVVIGDSVAAGEGIAYGYRYGYDRSDPDRSSWTGGTEDPRWEGDHQLCHRDGAAYGHVATTALGADLATFACTGATYLNGITSRQTTGETVMQPAQFGDWATAQQLNAAYDGAEPDVVVLTFGADDVAFSTIVRYCVSGYTTGESLAVEALAAAADPVGAVARALAARAPALAAELERGDRTLLDDVGSSYCTAANPGAPVEQLFWRPVTSGELTRHYREIVAAIQARGRDPRFGNGKVPKIIFTTYHRPLPAGLDGDCWDVYPLSGEEQAYLQSLQTRLQDTLEEAVTGLEGVSIADISATMDGHEWCTEDPWTYGLSVLWFDDPASQAPFHPTPDGQRAIASVVEAAIRSATDGAG